MWQQMPFKNITLQKLAINGVENDFCFENQPIDGVKDRHYPQYGAKWRIISQNVATDGVQDHHFAKKCRQMALKTIALQKLAINGVENDFYFENQPIDGVQDRQFPKIGDRWRWRASQEDQSSGFRLFVSGELYVTFV